MSDTIYTLGRDPEYVDFLAPKVLDKQGNVDFDPSTVTSWTMTVQAPNGTTAAWSVTEESATTEVAHLRHVYSASGAYDVPVPGNYHVKVTALTPAGTRRTFTKTIPAKDA